MKLICLLVFTLAAQSANVPPPQTPLEEFVRAVRRATGSQLCSVQATASVNATSCKSTPGVITAVFAENASADSAAYLRLYDTPQAPTCATSTGYVATFTVPQKTEARPYVDVRLPFPLAMSRGIGLCVTGGPAVTDVTNAPGWNTVRVWVLYKPRVESRR